MLPLFEEFPALAKGLPWVELCSLPTPVDTAPQLAHELGLQHLYVKRDDRSGERHGGNKVRKLEFLLGDALRRRKKEVITFGYAGSNHAAATAFYAHQLGLRSISMLLPQPNSPVVRQNLLLSHACNAELHQRPTKGRLAAATLAQLARHTLRRGRRPMMIPAGGSSPLGAAGFVNAAYELRNQIRAGQLAEPAAVYLALGSMGTAAGLLLGLQAAGLQSRVVAIQVTEPTYANAARTLHLADQTKHLLRRHDPSFPDVHLNPSQLDVRTEFFGPGYGEYTEQGAEAARLMEAHLAVPLDGTYSAKAFAALVHDARQGTLNDRPVLYWDTFNSQDMTVLTHKIDYHALPKAFQRYFEEGNTNESGG